MSHDPTRPSERPCDGAALRATQTGDAAPNDDADALPDDELFRVLADRRRRYVLHSLETAEMPMALADLADELVRWETDEEPTAVQDERERMYVSLYHHHLPKLAEQNLVALDLNRKLVSLREAADDLELGDVQAHRDGHATMDPNNGRQ
jgi:hypothetical protein